MRLFITGTDTGVGKTHFAAWLVRCWRRLGHQAIGLKPIAAGGDEDARALAEAAAYAWPVDAVNPVRWAAPLAPLHASEQSGTPPDLGAATACVRRAGRSFTHVAVEGVGGWLVPLTRRIAIRDWACELGLPVVIVARPGLGTLNHTLLTLESVRAARLPCLGIVLNAGLPGTDPADPSLPLNPETLRSLSGLPVFEYTGEAEAAGKLPAWLSREEG